MANSLCSSCGSPVEHPEVTGILCTKCHGDQVQAPGGWQRHVSGPAAVGIVAGGVPFFFSVFINGANVVAAGCGAVALLCGLVALPGALKAAPGEKGARAGLAAAALLLGAWQLFRSAFWLLF